MISENLAHSRDFSLNSLKLCVKKCRKLETHFSHFGEYPKIPTKTLFFKSFDTSMYKTISKRFCCACFLIKTQVSNFIPIRSSLLKKGMTEQFFLLKKTNCYCPLLSIVATRASCHILGIEKA